MSGTPSVFRAPSDNAQCILGHFEAERASVQRVCFKASSNASYFVRDYWSKYQIDTLQQESTATLRELLIQLHDGC